MSYEEPCNVDMRNRCHNNNNYYYYDTIFKIIAIKGTMITVEHPQTGERVTRNISFIKRFPNKEDQHPVDECANKFEKELLPPKLHVNRTLSVQRKNNEQKQLYIRGGVMKWS